MSLIPQRSLMGAAYSASQQSYNVPRSIAFNAPPYNTSYCIRTFAAGNRKLWTWSGWVKRAQIATGAGSYVLFSASTPSAYSTLGFDSVDNKFFLTQFNSSTYDFDMHSVPTFRDVTGWYHVVVAYDSDQFLPDDRVKVYINNKEITFTGTKPTQGLNSFVNSSGNHHLLGALETPSFNNFNNFFNGRMCEVTFVDGQALTPSSFGTLNTYKNQWLPKPYTGSFGTTGFYLPFNDATSTTTLGYDRSGNGNNFTLNGISVSVDVSKDVPTTYSDGGTGHGNYCQLNALNSYDQGTQFSPLRAARVYEYTGAAWLSCTGTQFKTSGKWYAECKPYTYGGSYIMAGVCNQTFNPINTATYPGQDTNSWGYFTNGAFYYNSTPVTSAPAYGWDAHIGIAIDLDNGKIWFSLEGVWINGGDPVSGTNPAFTIPVGNGEAYSFAFGAQANAVWTNFGDIDFWNTPPNGFKSMNTSNFTEPTLKNTSTAMASTIYLGNGTTQAVSNTGFYPSMAWIYNQDTAASHMFVDTIRGAQNGLFSNLDVAQVNQNSSGYVSALSSTGLTVSTGSTNADVTNKNGNYYSAWQWAANGSTAVSNTSGTLTTTVCANPAIGFSVVEATMPGTNVAKTLGHGLSTAPQMMFVKWSNATNNWWVYSKGMGPAGYMFLNVGSAQGSSSTIWNNTSPTSSVFSLGPEWNGTAGTKVIAYCWSEIPGYSKFGTYVGNGITNGPFVECGFRPKFVMYKPTNASNWVIVDATTNRNNVNSLYAAPGLTQGLGNTPIMDFLSNGFKLRIPGPDGNGAGISHIYMAFAENPAKYSLAR